MRGLRRLGLHFAARVAPGPWLHEDAFGGINYMRGEALLDDVLITDLTTILGGDFDVDYLVPSTGYDMTIDGTSGTRGFGTMLATGALLTRLQAMNWAIRIEFDLSNPFIAATWLRTIDGAGDGSEHYFGPGGTISTDFGGDYNPADVVAHPGLNRIATSNNAAGWEQSVNGATAVLSSPQTTATPDFISLCGDVDETGTINFYNGIYGIIRKIEWFPLRSAAQLQALSA